jgi:hypothetical protein
VQLVAKHRSQSNFALNKDKKIPVRKDSHKALVDFAMAFRVFELALDWDK